MYFLTSKLIYFIKEFAPFLIIDTLLLILSVIIFFKIFRSQISKRRKIITTAALATILFFFSNFTLAEAYFRFIYDNSDGLGFLKVNQKWQERHIVVNGDFRRDEEFQIQKSPSIERVCAIGDSITFGYGIEDINDRYTEILEKKLRNDNYRVEIFNLAVSGVNLLDAISTYRGYKFLNCDIILYQYALNDIRNNEDQAKLFEHYSKLLPPIKKASELSYFFDFVYWRFNQRYEDSFRKLYAIDINDFENPEKLNQHLSKIAQFAGEVKNDQKKMMVVIFPMFYSLDNNYPGWIHSLIATNFAKSGATVVDLLPFAVGRNLEDLRASRFDAHPSEYFHNLTAEKIYEPFKELLK
ncbi:SGNH/GDSL hydrolase family protein [Candidatus Woesebacteria bacterium]|nr:SGNH/GDSL hydrolase family protein [Candidatus Woesebacteria bacterium]